MNIFASTRNTRPILTGSFKFIRSDLPREVSEAERTWLIENDITTVIDLRTEKEHKKAPCPLEGDGRFKYLCFPVAGGDTVPRSENEVSSSYIAMVDGELLRLVEMMLMASENILYFCTAGKDRTGVLSAILLYKLGMPREYIVADYMRSRDSLRSVLDDYARNDPTVNIKVITPCERYIEEFLDWYINNEKHP